MIVAGHANLIDLGFVEAARDGRIGKLSMGMTTHEIMPRRRFSIMIWYNMLPLFASWIRDQLAMAL